MDEGLDRVLALKASAKRARDHEDWDKAIDDLREAIRFLRARMAATSSSFPNSLATELADVYGLMGGVQRRWGLKLNGVDRQHHLKESVAAYDEGFYYEKDLHSKDANTYNRVNRLVGRVLLDPHVLNEVTDELLMTEVILDEEIGSARQKDPWAYCDLGTIQLLLGNPDALLTFQKLDRMLPPAFVYGSTLSTLEPLCQVVGDLRPDCRRAIAQLQRSARYRDS